MSRVEVTISYAILKKNYDTFGKMENFVRVKLIGTGNNVSEFKTKIVDGDKNSKIVWNESIVIPVQANGDSYLEFTVFDEDQTSNDVCGVGLLHLNTTGVFFGGVNKFNIRLHVGSNDEVSGELHVSTRYF